VRPALPKGGAGPFSGVVAVRNEWLLDDWTLPQLSEALGTPIRVVKPLAANFAEAVLGEDW
jgi:hypothetical protein